ncbi:MAG: acetyl-CoA carboxylase biotin carboxyl carrier protein subunit [Lachnospiraceae bacterium]|jgi:biotin carboxyl carrier protein|nr:acetyl-CoA carboxylase biotin carboxyl carrier protein subunit [Lachnospiraceae bacterium]MBP5702689.1 acetyl-CoA carboxylase biotin carboxyl carrier protein subunit [Lachnospiraceae bacterium]MBP5763361.1 acetyl-CoA carboxylase biotin carboxyl carrier protein subunit [Lachnospiraceae bacterium]MCR5619001.1 acetyl-CoA carboxylase biotin carboxyl carrier protein subunit [Lachnospiraceae bacterium]
MKNYTITVNGTAYAVTVEENGAAPAVAAPAKPAAAAPAPAAAPAAAKSAGAGSIKVEAGAAGKVLKAVKNVGDAVKKGDPVVVIESMKMEINCVAPQDGTVASIDCNAGDPVEAGAVLATLN